MSDRGSVRWHRGGWEVSLQVEGRRVFRRVKAPNTRAGRRAAEKALDQLGTEVGLGLEGMTVGLLLDAYRMARTADWSPSTVAAHDGHAAAILRDLGDVEVGQLRPAAIEAVYGRWVAGGAAPGTVRRRHAVLSAALTHAERWGVVPVSPARGVKLPKVTRRRLDDLPEIGVVLAAVGRIGHDELRVAARLAVATGARRGELVALRWSDVDLEVGAVRFMGSIAAGPDRALVRKSTKGGRPKVLALDAGTVAVLVEWRAKGRGRGPVLPSPSDPTLPWHPGQVTLMWHRHRETVGLGHLRFHDLRHLHATALLGAGVPVHTVADRLGHSARMTLDVYGHAIPAHDQVAAAVIGRAERDGDA